MSKDSYDVIVVGAGNAALCAAISAHEQGAKVLVLEKAPVDERGGNSLFTAGGFRFVHDGLADVRQDILDDLSASEADQIVLPDLKKDDYLDDLRRVTEGQTDDTLSELLVGRSRDTMRWMRANKVRFIPMFGRQSYKIEGKHHFYGGVNIEAVGGGWGLVDQLIKRAESLGIEIRYATAMRKLLQDQKGVVTGVHVMGPEGYADIHAKSVVLACGGFEANPEMRVRYYGAGWESCRVRGTRYNTGDGLNAALAIDAQAFGGWSTCHAVQWDISAPPFGDRVVLDNFQKHSYPIGIVVNMKGERFVDEGADYRNHTYAKYGREVMKQPQRAAVQIFDSKTIDMVRDEYRIHQVTKATADTIEELAQKLEINVEGLKKTVSELYADRLSGEGVLTGDGYKAMIDGYVSMLEDEFDAAVVL
jgi:tricarballylate dehydrogenase